MNKLFVVPPSGEMNRQRAGQRGVGNVIRCVPVLGNATERHRGRSLQIIFAATLLAMPFFLLGCGGKPANKGDKPANVYVDEKKLSTVELSPEAELRLGIKTVAVKLERVRRQRSLGGEVTVPPGQAIIVAAPVSGTLSIPEGGEVYRAGQTVEPGDAIFTFTPLLSPERAVLTPAERVNMAQVKATLATSQIEAERQVQAAKLQVDATQIAYARALKLLRDQAGSQRAVDETQAQFQIAQEAFKTAEARHKLLAAIDLDTDAGQQVSYDIKAPVGGFLRGLHVAPGEIVATGAPLFEVVTHDKLWIRIPIYVGWWRDVAADEDALFTEFGQSPDAAPNRAKPVEAPRSADPLATTVDLFYETPNNGGRLRPGQRVSVKLAMQGEEKSLVTPLAAIIYDIHGNAWVYEQTAERTFVRRQVLVRFIDHSKKGEARAVVSSGLKEGDLVVTDGAAELRGTEFGFAK